MCLRYHAHANDQDIMIDPYAEKHDAWYSGNADFAWLHVALRVQQDLQSAHPVFEVVLGSSSANWRNTRQ